MSDIIVKDLSGLDVIALSPTRDRLAELEAGIRNAGVLRVRRCDGVEDLCIARGEQEPGLLLLDVPGNHSGMLSALLKAIDPIEAPAALFLESNSDIDIESIMDAGVSTIVVDGFAAKRLPQLIQTTLVRHKRLRGLEIELAEARSALEDRKLVDRAKSILMDQRNISEPDAYALLRSAAMSRNCKVAEIANSIIIAHTL